MTRSLAQRLHNPRKPLGVTEATITCPVCGTAARETMPQNACRYFYLCTGCGTQLKPKAGDCCVFCSYSDEVCPPKRYA